ERRLAVFSAWLAGVGVLVGVDAFLVEPRWVEVTGTRVTSEKLHRPVKLVVIADLQTDHVGEYEAEVLRLAAAQDPDLVLFTGDYVQEPYEERNAEERRKLNTLLRSLTWKPRLGMYAVRGDSDAEGWPDIFDGTGVVVLESTTTLRIGELTLTGLDLETSRTRVLDLKPTDELHVVFGHAPDFALVPFPADVLVAGHTHGGQVQLPLVGPLVTLTRVPRAWAAGRTDMPDGRTLLVSRGLGMERVAAPRLRFLCRPELMVVDLLPSS
ncbi:MAG: metallophosphoesterase, partial [Myxococcota bacterium]